MLRVLEPGALSTVQDGGRRTAVHLGVPISGACDAWSMTVANRLLDNAHDAAVLEMTLLGATLEVTASGVVALAGADMEAHVVEDGRPLMTGRSHRILAGTTLRFGAALHGARTYLALPGGIDVEPVLGSRSTCLSGGFGGLGGRSLAAGDELRAARPPTDGRPNRRWSSGVFDPTAEQPIRIVALPGAPGLDRNAVQALLQSAWTVSPIGDRTGLRLDGTAMPIDEAAAALVSAGVLPGALQLPPSGLPIVLLADAPTVGGYPVPAMVASADQPVVAQRQPGDVLTFVRVTAGEARSAAIARRAVLAERGVEG